MFLVLSFEKVVLAANHACDESLSPTSRVRVEVDEFIVDLGIIKRNESLSERPDIRIIEFVSIHSIYLLIMEFSI